ncbi:MAG: hypothetical protein L6R39_001945 [Caloplaca ligustica]|nr:MAG: hypothetical protein L6R39_001945 [Caloplaca ligustica]
MASSSSLPKPARGGLNTFAASDGVTDSYGPEDILSQRKRAITDAGSVLSGTLLDRRSRTGNQRPAPLTVPHLKHSKNKDDTPTLHSQPTSPHTTLLDGRPSAPIAIPTRKTPSFQPITPLTGRVPTFFQHSPKQSHTPPQRPRSKDFTPSPDSQSQSSQSEQEAFALSPFSRHAMRLDRGGPSPMYTPSSPLSPTMAPYTTTPFTQQNARAQPKQPRSRVAPEPLAIPSLPPFHPANYESRHASPHNSRPGSSSHGRQLSDAQKKILKNQRELVINAARAATVKSPLARPTSPRLNPLVGSPGPVTPLMLESQSDYFSAGSSSASPTSPKSTTDRKELMERLIATERDRAAHPERADRHSPAVSPAGGPG